MKRILAFLAAGFAGALITLLTMNFAASAFAQGPTNPGTVTPGSGPYGAMQGGRGTMMGQGGGRGAMMDQSPMGGSAESLIGMAAAKLNMSQADLIAQLGDTGTIAAALTDGGVDPKDFIAEFVASRAERLNAAVAAGTITQDEADARLATAESMATTRINQPFSVMGPGSQGPNQGQGGQGGNFVDEDGDGVCDLMPAGGQGPTGGRRGPHR